MLGKIANSKSKTFQACCFCFLLGIVWASRSLRSADAWMQYVLFAGLCTAALVWTSAKARFTLLTILCFVAGVYRTHLLLPVSEEHVSSWNGQTVQITGRVVREPDIRQESVRYVLEVVAVDGDPVHGRVHLKLFLYPRFSYAEQITVRCRLTAPEPFDGFRYDMYLANQRIFSLCEQGSVLSSEGAHKSTAFARLFAVKNKLATRINRLWPEPYAGFMAGLLYGYRGGLGSLDQAFADTGLTHIVAISGYNITMIATILLTLCVRLWIPKRFSFWLILFGIAVFVFFVGASASVVRAGIMGSLVISARQLGRPQQIGGVLLLTASIMALHSPLSLLWDAGFQLSFLATIGLIYVSPKIERFFTWVPEAFALRESVSSTLAAIIATQPLVLYQFERMSLVAPVVNVLVLWAIPLCMMLGFFAVMASACVAPLGTFVSWCAFLAMRYVTFVTELFAELAWASVPVSVPLPAMLGAYLILFLYIRKKAA